MVELRVYTWDNFLVSCCVCVVLVLFLLLLNSLLKTVSEDNAELEAVSMVACVLKWVQPLTTQFDPPAMGPNTRAARHGGLLKGLR